MALRTIPDPASLGYDWPAVQTAWQQAARLRERLTAAQAAEASARKAVTESERNDQLARKLAIAGDKPLPKPTVERAQAALVEAKAITQATQAALADAERDLNAAVEAAKQYLLTDSEARMDKARAAYAEAIEAMAAARATFAEQQGMLLYLQAFPNAVYKPGSGYLQNQPGGGLLSTGGPAPMFDATLAQLRADATKPTPKVRTGTPLRPTEQTITAAPVGGRER